MILILVSTPRSGSVAFLRYMESRANFDILHEPLVKLYSSQYLKGNDVVDQYFDQNKGFKSFQELKSVILEYIKTGRNLFIKEMCWSALTYFQSEPDLLANDNIKFLIMARQPEPCLVSFYKALNVSSSQTITEILGPLRLVFKFLSDFISLLKTVKKDFKLIKTEDLILNTQPTIADICASLDLPFNPEHLQWKSKSETFDAYQQWKEPKYTPQIWHWHYNALKSQTIDSQIMVNGQISSVKEEHKQEFLSLLEENRPYYQQLIA